MKTELRLVNVTVRVHRSTAVSSLQRDKCQITWLFVSMIAPHSNIYDIAFNLNIVNCILAVQAVAMLTQCSLPITRSNLCPG